jgi:hypothetical protein
MDDVIGQGREPERERPPLPRRWRAAGWALAAVAALGVGVAWIHHGTGAPGAPGATRASGAAAPTAAGGSVWVMPADVLPVPQAQPAIVICSPSTGACSMRGHPVFVRTWRLSR